MTSSIAAMLSIGLLPSFMKKSYYRMRGAKIGKGVSLGFLSVLDADHIEIGDHSRIGMMVRIRAKRFKMGAYSQIQHSTTIAASTVRIGNETTISHDVTVGGLESWESKFVIGDRCTVFMRSFINPTKNVIIGDDVGIGGSNYLFTHGSWSNALEGFPMGFGPIMIEDRVWLPWRVFVLPGVTIGHDSVIAAGSVVSKSIPPMSLAAGVPAKVMKSGDDFVVVQSKEQKTRTLTQWFAEFPSFLRMARLIVSGSPEAEHAIWSGRVCEKNGRVLGSVLVVGHATDEMTSTSGKRLFLLALDSVPADTRKQVESGGGAWFDLKDYVWGGSRDRLTVELRSFLEQFGVRFESTDLREERQ